MTSPSIDVKTCGSVRHAGRPPAQVIVKQTPGPPAHKECNPLHRLEATGAGVRVHFGHGSPHSPRRSRRVLRRGVPPATSRAPRRRAAGRRRPARQRGVVQSASYGARRFGIHAGMPIGQAVRLCPQATFFQGVVSALPRAPRAPCAAVLERFTPTVVMASLDEAYLDFAGTERLYPVSLLPVAEQLRDEVRRDTGLDCSIGIGPNRMIAKLASDAAKPRGPDGGARRMGGRLSRRPRRSRRCRASGPRRRARWVELGLMDVWQVQQMEEAGARAADRPRGAGAQAAGARLRRHARCGASGCRGR